MAIEVFWGSGSPYAWRVLLALEIKGVSYESRLLQFSKGEHKAPDFVKLSPRGKVPAIREGDFALSESLAILAWLERRFPDPPIFGATAAETGLIWRAVMDFQCYVEEPLTDGIVRPLFFGRAAQDPGKVEAAIPTLHAELGRLDEALAGRSWMVGGNVSAADVVWLPALQSLRRAAGKPQAAAFDLGVDAMSERWHAVAAWVARMEGLPGYDRAYPPHWKDAR